MMPKAALQAARHAAAESAPSGQHGQWPESAAMPDMSIMPWHGEASACELPASALAKGAAEINCAATST